jgi:hypothetical protein
MTARLVLDDNRSHPYLRSGADGGWHARTAAQALALLDVGAGYDEIWLDHDLADGIDVWPFVDHLCLMAHEGRPYPAAITVHSQNPTGADNIVRALNRQGYRARRVGLWPLRVADFDLAPELAVGN